jgi:sugar O-acyltransferase (sialic acid O-acetyltransferase NeuD family)
MSIAIIGAGGFAKEMLGSMYKFESFAGFFEERGKDDIGSLMGAPVMDISQVPENAELIFAIGSPARERLIHIPNLWNKLHPRQQHLNAIVGDTSDIGIGSILCANSVITENCKIGAYVIVNINATIGHDCNIGDYTTISPNCAIGGHVMVGNGCFIGLGSVIIPRKIIGNNVFIGAGSVVTKDIPENSLVYGNPARIIRQITKEELYKLV